MNIPHDFPFDPAYGYTLEELMAVPAPVPPDDFDAFWRRHLVETLDLPLNLERREIESARGDTRVYELEFDSYRGVRVGGWITAPRDVAPTRGMVVGHGYGGREAPMLDLPVADAACVFPCARGFHRSAHPDIPGNAVEHVLHGIEHRDTYSHLGSTLDYARAASALLELYPDVAHRLFYSGGSFGGGIGALLLACDNRFHRAHLNIPSFGNHPLRASLPCEGSGKAVKERVDAGDHAILEVLRYFDAATAATRIHIPVFAACATFDPAVPPPGQFAVYNALPGPKSLFLRQAAHFDLAGNEHDDAAIDARLRRWFAD